MDNFPHPLLLSTPLDNGEWKYRCWLSPYDYLINSGDFVPFSLWFAIMSGISLLFWSKSEDDHCAAPIIFAWKRTRLTWDSNSLFIVLRFSWDVVKHQHEDDPSSEIFLVLRSILTVALGLCVHCESWKDIPLESILSKDLHSGWTTSIFPLHAVCDCWFVRHQSKTNISWIIFPINCFHAKDLFGHQFLRYVEHLPVSMDAAQFLVCGQSGHLRWSVGGHQNRQDGCSPETWRGVWEESSWATLFGGWWREHWHKNWASTSKQQHLLSSTHWPPEADASASRTQCRPCPTQIQRQQCCPSMASALSIWFLGLQCWPHWGMLQDATGPSHLCANFTVVPRSISGRMISARPMKFCKVREGNRETPSCLLCSHLVRKNFARLATSSCDCRATSSCGCRSTFEPNSFV